jgi:hypothetical protein
MFFREPFSILKKLKFKDTNEEHTNIIYAFSNVVYDASFGASVAMV